MNIFEIYPIVQKNFYSQRLNLHDWGDFISAFFYQYTFEEKSKLQIVESKKHYKN